MYSSNGKYLLPTSFQSQVAFYWKKSLCKRWKLGFRSFVFPSKGERQTLLAFLVNYTRHNLIYSSLLLRGNNCQINRKLFLQIAEGQFSGVTAAGLRVQRPWRRCRPPSSARPPISPPSPPATHPPSSSTHAVAPDRKFFLEKCPICTWTL